MGRTILCNECHSTFDEDILKKKNSENKCLVCGASLVGDDCSEYMETPDKNSNGVVEKKTYYYYDDGSATMTKTLYNHIKPIYTFQATDMEDAERQLKEVCPNSPLLKPTPSREIRCPRCSSKEYTLLNKGYSIFTGFLGSGRVKRVCNYCKKEF